MNIPIELVLNVMHLNGPPPTEQEIIDRVAEFLEGRRLTVSVELPNKRFAGSAVLIQEVTHDGT